MSLPVQFNSTCGSPKHGEIYNGKWELVSFPFSTRNYFFLFKKKKPNNFTKLSTTEAKIINTSQTKNTQARRTPGLGIFTSPRPILLASGTGPPANFEDCYLIIESTEIKRKIPKYNCNIRKISKEIRQYIYNKVGVDYINKSKVLQGRYI